MTDVHVLSATHEDYIEVISRLVVEKGAARVRDIARALSVHKSTVTAALRHLSDKNLVNYAPYEAATLTERGRKLANEVTRRHEVIQRFLSDVLLLNDGVAAANACRMEHVMDREALLRLSLFAKFAKECSGAGEDWLQRFGDYCERKRCLAEEAKTKEGSEEVMTTLDQLRVGQKAKILRVGRGGAVGRRIVDMGVVRGTPVEIMKVAPLGDPIEVKVKGYNLSLRKEEAAGITVEPE